MPDPYPLSLSLSRPQGWVLGAFFYGYLLVQIPGAWLAQRFGSKYVFGIGVVMTAVLTLLTPLAAQASVWVLVVLRVLEGLFEVTSIQPFPFPVFYPCAPFYQSC